MGSFSIIDIKSTHPKSINYFFDANIWLVIINSSSSTLSKEKAQYVDFFDGICNLRATLISQKKNVALPSIIVSPLLISEIFNRYMRIAFNKWKDEMVDTGKLSKSQAADKDYKKDYRGGDHFDNAVKQFRSDFLGYQEYIDVMDDDVKKVDPFDILKNFPANTDFNDMYYFTFCYENKISIVTHDGDFLFSGIDIITSLPQLLAMA